MTSRLFALAVAALTAIGLAGAPNLATAAGEKFVLISHAPDSDSWWNTIKNAIKVAGEQMDVRVDYRNPPTGDLADMARIVEQASAANPDGIIVTIADFDVLKGPIADAVDKGIPVITINSGTQKQSEELGALLHVGQPEYDAGLGAGKQAKKAGVKKFLCVNHYITNPASVERCQGYAAALGVKLGRQMIDSGQDPAEIKNKVKAYLKQQQGRQRHSDPGSRRRPTRHWPRCKIWGSRAKSTSPPSTSPARSPPASRTAQLRSPSTSSPTSRATCPWSS